MLRRKVNEAVMDIAIFGAGHLTRSLLLGLAKSMSDPIRLFNRNRAKAGPLRAIYPQLHIVGTPQELMDGQTAVFLIIPPKAILQLPQRFWETFTGTDSLVVSCANGLSIKDIETVCGSLKIVRFLPNILWQIAQGTTLFQPNALVTDREKEALLTPIRRISRLQEIQIEDDFDRLGRLTSCGPGLMSALMVELLRGFDLQTSSERDNVRDILLATLTYQKLTHHSFDAIVEEVANPGGLTGHGVQGINETLPAAFEHVVQRMEAKITERRGLLQPEISRRTVVREIEQME